MEELVIARRLAGRRVLVTGQTGFKGAWLCAWLRELGADVYGYALRPDTQPNLFDAIDLPSEIDHCVGDVRSFDDLKRRVDAVRPDLVLHLAAQALVRESYRTPRETFDTNAMGTVNLLEAIRLRSEPCAVVVVTSDKCYENQGRRAHVENDPMGGHDPYSASKGAAELVVSSYRRSFFAAERFSEHGVSLASARAGNVIGGGDWSADRLIPDIVRAVAEGRRPPVRNPAAVRPWQHVLDALSGYLLLASRMLSEGAEGLAEAWNFGPADADFLTVGQLTDRILRQWNDEGWERVRETDAPHEAEILRLDCSKARARLHWEPTWDVQAATEATVAWYRSAHDGGDLRQATDDQIAGYTATARATGRSWAVAGERLEGHH